MLKQVRGYTKNTLKNPQLIATGRKYVYYRKITGNAPK